MHSEYRDPRPLPGEKPVPSIKVDAMQLLGLLLRAEYMMTAVDRRRYANRAIAAIENVIGDFQIAHDFEDERLYYLKKMWADIAVFMDYMRLIAETNAIRVNLTGSKHKTKEGDVYETMTPDQIKLEIFNRVASLDEGASRWKNSILRNKGTSRANERFGQDSLTNKGDPAPGNPGS